MIKHLTYTITRGYKVGYGALFTKIFTDFDIDVSKEAIILPRVENLLGKATMKLLKLTVVNGKAVVNAGRCEAEEDEAEASEEEETQKATLQEKEKKETKTRKKSVARKRKRNNPPTRTSKRTKVKRVAPEPTHHAPIEIIDDDETVSTPHQGETNVPGSSSKAKEQGETSGQHAQQDSLLQLILQRLQALETTQQTFINDTKASIAALKSNIAGLHTAIMETRNAIIDKVDSIVVEEVSVDHPS